LVVKLAVLDRESALDHVGGDAQLLAEIAGLFLNEYPAQLATLTAAVQQGDPRLVEKTAHALKGSLATFGAQPAVAAALKLEQAGRAGDLSQAPVLIGDLGNLLQTLHTELDSL
jgi:HPt (histidine-containing phosphotransfer) domain-containing protein